MDVTGRSALVSGGASGLGLATARALLDRGASVVLLDLPSSRGSEVAAELGVRAAFVPGDVTNEADVRAALAAVPADRPLGVVVSCAGIATPGRVLGRDGVLPLDAFDRVVRVNLLGTFNLARLGAEAMAHTEADADGERGVIVQTASVAAFDGQIGQAAYSASKGGVAAMTLPLAREFARVGIRVVTIAPGIMETPMMAGLPEDARVSLGSQVPFPARLGRPDEYASLVLHIAENAYLNGETIRLDGAIRMGPK
ncbi:NAD(P)-dependent dehydrogenase (short-subunit alcohol dehydrogenase family) [Labedella gwakjiensis]|uniref:3-hydroxyacyl-CoA dehydrogenase n=1 Tax=Labedella gwakjiensis TaxID=390269 RepID=A0A2P8GVV5_9MICO|nr:3-hydroxyacyl-CoA dehydrogenase [Labedella gwakjiensis]PSL38102.1 NAD(P)-dependent dehydrogenase (short-subunit alcohol dehydrogenase family) [Labedella gwakjiensis]RUQ87345.1 3-hydroxyacyl-CoA dehydrogenase [Labedella gwakjiensis]